ncbi:MAG: cysteine hydrolase [Deltaproteobacteria bacterium]|nr:cysteine hydrolase [Deltaproteobacteria bacterium]
MENTALLIIDIQNDYFPSGNFELDGALEAAKKTSNILSFFRSKGMPVIHIQHESVKEGSTFFLPGTDGVKIHNSVKPDKGEVVVKKNYPNSFLKTDLLKKLKENKIDNLVITGMMTLMCVDATTRAAKDLGFNCTLIHDATAARELSFNGQTVSADDVKTSFLAALSMVADRTVSCDEYLRL